MTPSAIVHCRKQDLSTRLEFIGVRGFSEPQKPSHKVKKMLLPEKCFRRHTGTISKLTFVEEGGSLKMLCVCALLRCFRNLRSGGKCIFSSPFFSCLCTQKIFAMYSPLLFLREWSKGALEMWKGNLNNSSHLGERGGIVDKEGS